MRGDTGVGVQHQSVGDRGVDPDLSRARGGAGFSCRAAWSTRGLLPRHVRGENGIRRDRSTAGVRGVSLPSNLAPGCCALERRRGGHAFPRRRVRLDPRWRGGGVARNADPRARQLRASAATRRCRGAFAGGNGCCRCRGLQRAVVSRASSSPAFAGEKQFLK